ncbi:MAG TPA: sigma-70 family RNA polymerase sigma factor [Fimbriimonas sp.]|nr:sigma-70 family RNA polymerase sigma factor [Fimbriimonas sp.]
MRVSWDEVEEEGLVLAAQAGSLSAFDQLAARYRPAGVLVAQRVIKCREGAEDAVQDALLKAFKALPQLQNPSRFAAWFGAIVRNRAIRLSQNPARHEEPLEAHLDRLILREAPSISASGAESYEAVEELQQLPEELIEIARLYYLHEWPIKQISDLLGLPVSTVKWRLHEARRRLKGRLANLSEK